jgi:BASS family bile acid:Na+ symporter
LPQFVTMEKLIIFGISASIFTLVFCLGLAASLRDLSHLFRRPGLAARSLLSMNVIMPLIAAALVAAFNLPPAVKIALIALSVSPVPPILPKKIIKAGGSSEYAVGLLMAAVLFSLFFVPAALNVLGRAFGRSVDIPVGAIAKVVLSTVLFPLVAGVVVHRRFPGLAARLQSPLSKLATLLLIASILPVLFVSWPAMWSLIGNGTLIAAIVFSVLGLTTGYLLGGPDRSHRTVLALSTASRHPGVAASIVRIAFPSEKTALAAVLLVFIVSGITSTFYLRRQRRPAADLRRRAA